MLMKHMDYFTFWKLIDASRRAAKGDPADQVAILKLNLEKLPTEDIVEFNMILSDYLNLAHRWNLWEAAHVICGGYCSDDGFLYFKGWLISLGEKAYRDALRDPETLAKYAKPKVYDYGLEEILYVAGYAWRKVAGKSDNDFLDDGSIYQTEPAGPRSSQDPMLRFPILAKYYKANIEEFEKYHEKIK